MAGAPASRSGGRRSTTRTATVSLTRPLLLFFSAALLLPLLAARAAHAKGLDVTLKARWEGTSFVLEAAEFLAEEGERNYWDFVEQDAPALASASQAAPAAAAQEEDEEASWCWRPLVAAARRHALPQVGRLLPVVLGVRQYSARLQMYRQVAAELAGLPQEAPRGGGRQQQQEPPPPPPCCLAVVEGSGASAAAAAVGRATSAAELRVLLAQQPRQDDGGDQDDQDAAADDSAAVELFSFDHVYPQPAGAARAAEAAAAAATGGIGGRSSSSSSSSATAARRAVLYGPTGAPCFAEMHAVLKEAVNEAAFSPRPIAYAHRPWMPPGGAAGLAAACGGAAAAPHGDGDGDGDGASSAKRLLLPADSCLAFGTGEQLSLPGYGVEAVLKNTEYSAMDDKEQQQQGGGGNGKAASGGDDDDEDDSAAIKIGRLRDVGLNAAAHVSRAPDPLAALADVSQRFPLLAPQLAANASSSSGGGGDAGAGGAADLLRRTIAHNQRVVPSGASVLMLNGLQVEVGNFELTAFLDRLRIDLRLQGALRAAGLGPKDALAALRARAEDRAAAAAAAAAANGGGGGGGTLLSDLRLDLGRRAVRHLVPWINDLERDPEYSRHPRSLQALLGIYPGMLHMQPLALNLLSAFVVGEPGTLPSLAAGDAVYRSWARGGPYRLAYVPAVPDVLRRRAAAAAGGVGSGAAAAAGAGAPRWADAAPQERAARAFLAMYYAHPTRRFAAYYFWSRVCADESARRQRHEQQQQPPSSPPLPPHAPAPGAFGDEAALRAAFERAWAESVAPASARGSVTSDPQALADARAAWDELVALDPASSFAPPAKGGGGDGDKQKSKQQLSPAATAVKRLDELSDVLLARGLAPGGRPPKATLWLNGQLLPLASRAPAAPKAGAFGGALATPAAAAASPVAALSAAIERDLSQAASYETQLLQEEVYYGRLRDGDEPLQALLDSEAATTVQRWNAVVLGAAGAAADEEGGGGSSGGGGGTTTTATAAASSEPARHVNLAGPVALRRHPGARALGRTYLVSPGKHDTSKGVTHWVAADLLRGAGRRLARDALSYVLDGALPASETEYEEPASARVGLLLCGGGGGAGGRPAGATTTALEAAVAAALRAYGGPRAAARLGKEGGIAAQRALIALVGLPEELAAAKDRGEEAAASAAAAQLLAPLPQDGALPAEARRALERAVAGPAAAPGGAVAVPPPDWSPRALLALAAGPLRAQRELCASELGLAPGAGAVVTNGRLVIAHGGARAAAAAAADSGAGEPEEEEEELSAVSAADFDLMHMWAMEMQPGTHVARVARLADAEGLLRAAQEAEEGEEEEKQQQARGDAAAAAERAALLAAARSDAAMVASSALAAQTYPDGRYGSLYSKQLTGALNMLRGESVTARSATFGRGDGGGGGGGDNKQGEEPADDLNFVAILNPLSRVAQRMSALLVFLRDALGAEDAAAAAAGAAAAAAAKGKASAGSSSPTTGTLSIRLYLNPELEVKEFPLKSFYTYAVPAFTPSPAGLGAPVVAAAAASSSSSASVVASFPRLPAKRVLTVGLEVPEAWLVEATEAEHDMDNLRLADVPEAVARAGYELEAVLVTGSCVATGGSGGGSGSSGGGKAAAAAAQAEPPRGLQLRLGTAADPHRVDTLVMSNLGYFQLQAAPGLWRLSTAPGRSRDLYALAGSDGAASEGASSSGVGGSSGRGGGGGGGGGEGSGGLAPPTSDNSTLVVVSSFSGKHVTLRVRKRPGREHESLLREPPKEGEDPAAAAERRERRRQRRLQRRRQQQGGGYFEQEEDEGDYDDDDDDDDEVLDQGGAAAAASSGGGLWGSVKGLLGGGGGDKAAAATANAAAVLSSPSPIASNLPYDVDPADGVTPVINVFTVASGHMYERLQKIMMLSVLRGVRGEGGDGGGGEGGGGAASSKSSSSSSSKQNTPTPKVKFWILKNYASPSHRRVVPRMAQRYGFDYAFVTYKWPHWLRKQTEKQRVIWAYKILFLDVIFPLGVKRAIFVDSDQVVRTNLLDLASLELKPKKAALAYTPFCDNQPEMDEYRFWKGGFWKDHLRGKPYHISALYLIDLERFRRTGAGDGYRVIYDNLSRDPNSLANLDQDLPNYAQHSIPLHSLPREWLWCETWCGNSTKAQARTIDLCNNPRTKEPKLTAARRIIAEWPGLDAEQAAVTAEIEAELLKAEEEGARLLGGGGGGAGDGAQGDGAQAEQQQREQEEEEDGGGSSSSVKDEL